MFLFCVFIFSLSFFHFLFIVYLVYDFIINIYEQTTNQTVVDFPDLVDYTVSRESNQSSLIVAL